VFICGYQFIVLMTGMTLMKRRPFFTPMRLTASLLLGLALALAFGDFTTSSTMTALKPQQQPLTTLKLAQVKERGFEVRTLEGRRVPLAQLFGQDQPVLLNFWATWCGPCRIEIPHLLELAKQYREQGLTIIGLTVEDPVEDQAAVKAFAKELGINYQIAFASPELFSFFNGDDPRGLLPQTFVFATDGRLVRRIVGYNAQRGKEFLTQAIELAMKPGSPSQP
jgi:thiol-disulfide isomerase/thioredoxin